MNTEGRLTILEDLRDQLAGVGISTRDNLERGAINSALKRIEFVVRSAELTALKERINNRIKVLDVEADEYLGS